MMSELGAALLRLDVSILQSVNHGWSSPPLDAFFSFVTEQRNYALPGALLAVYLWMKKGLRGRLCLLTLLLGVAVSDPLSSRLIKPMVHRVRPCAAVPGVLTPHGDRGTFSFPSSHAVNIASTGVIIGMSFPAWALPAFVLALFVGLSRVYLGLHYPSDVLVGYLLGAVLGWACWKAVQREAARRGHRVEDPHEAARP